MNSSPLGKRLIYPLFWIFFLSAHWKSTLHTLHMCNLTCVLQVRIVTEQCTILIKSRLPSHVLTLLVRISSLSISMCAQSLTEHTTTTRLLIILRPLVTTWCGTSVFTYVARDHKILLINALTISKAPHKLYTKPIIFKWYSKSLL